MTNPLLGAASKLPMVNYFWVAIVLRSSRRST